ncbi:MAG TPA: hypothetical protein VFY29_01050 [Terriglobia bacterium]|nr:hypothetical protein [Terriglobia bacterium]
MAPRSLHLVVRTPHAVAVETDALSLRVLTETGQVGLRPGAEPAVFAIEAGLVVVRTSTGERIVGTAGGLLLWDSREAVLLTPLAIAGNDRDEMDRKLRAELAEPGEEMLARAQLGRLEDRILEQIRRERSGSGGRLRR